MIITQAQAERVEAWASVHPDGCVVEGTETQGIIKVFTKWEGLKSTDPRWITSDGEEYLSIEEAVNANR